LKKYGVPGLKAQGPARAAIEDAVQDWENRSQPNGKILPCRAANRYTLSLTCNNSSELAEIMNAPSELSHEDMLSIRLEVLRREHRDLDTAIDALEATARPDQLMLRRLKKQKLSLKDQIVKLEDQLIPDIIA